MTKNLAIIGLGKLGLPLAACYALRGVQVIGADIDEAKVDAVNSRKVDFYEPGLRELLRGLPPQALRATTDVKEAVACTDAAIIMVATPSEADSAFSLRYVLPACETVGAAIRSKDYYLVSLSSTVMPGATDGPVREVLERASGKRCGEGFGLCHVPEFIALGQIISGYLGPAHCILGESDRRAGDEMATILRRMVGARPQIVRMSLTNAELVKIAANVMLTLKIGYANTLAQICQALPGADVDVVTKALGQDPRISPAFLRAGAAFGGPCFPRDVRALSRLAARCGASPSIVDAIGEANRGWAGWMAALVKRNLPPGGTVGILGLTYKPGVPLLLASPGIWLVEALKDVPIVVHDPLLRDVGLPRHARWAGSVAECAAGSDVVVVVMPWPGLDENLLAGKIVIDCWRDLEGEGHIAFGRGKELQ